MYIPSSKSAYVRKDSPFLPSDIFHEYFGHGLFLEHSKLGHDLTNIISEGGNFNSFLFDKIDHTNQLFGVEDYNIQNYEGFAVWIENLLSSEMGYSAIFEKKKSYLNKDYLVLLDQFNELEQNLSRFGLMAQMGFPKYYTSETVLDVVKRHYGPKINTIDFILLRGSRKPESDIDLFIVSSNPSRNYFNGWLDIYELNRADFIDWRNKLDISVTDPLFEGEYIFGNESFFENSKRYVFQQPITQDAITHHILEIDRLKKYDSPTFHDEISRQKYIDSFSWNLEELKKGNKALTLQRLKAIN